jgi:hypothetical protein
VEGARETAPRTIRDGQRASEVIARLRALFGKEDTTTESVASVDLNEATREVVALSSSELQRSRVILLAGTCRRSPTCHRCVKPFSETALIEALQRASARPW